MANLNIKLVKSLNGRLEKQVATAHSLGLRKIGDITVQPDNDQTRGKIAKIGGMADAIYQGVHEAVIIDGRVPHSILLELFSNRGSGTRFYRRSHRE